MIQKMSKYAFLVFHGEHKQFLEQLRDLGVVHIQEQRKTTEVQALQNILQERNQIKEQHKTLKAYIPKQEEETNDTVASTPLSGDIHERITQINALIIKREEYKVSLEQKQTELYDLEPWGNFEIAPLKQLEQAGYTLRFYTTNTGVFTEEYASTHGALQVNQRGTMVYFVVLQSAGQLSDLPDTELVRTPEISIPQLKEELEQLRAEQEAFEQSFIEEVRQLIPQLEAYDQELGQSFSFRNAEAQSVALADDKLRLLEGWIPTTEAPALEAQLNGSGYYYKELEIADEDNIPIKLKNNTFTRPFELITEMFSLPNAGEIDQTALLAPFFMLFFALCFGDGGYGTLLLIGATYVKLRNRGKENSVLTLLQWLGGTAIVVGLLMGSVFGVTLGYAKAKDYVFGQDGMMTISIILGIVQIFFAKLVAVYKIKIQRGMKYALAPLAWVVGLLTVGAYLLLGQMSLPSIEWVNYLLYGLIGISFVVAFFYNSPGKNPLLNFGSGLWTAYNTASGLLGDTLSYIRLFAIGLTGGILGSVFNDLAFGTASGMNPFIGYPLALLILLFGHGLNIGLSIISSFVHPLRLTFVEYYKNSEFEGGGKPYTPFKK